MIYKLISSKSILAKIIADLDLTETSIDITDFKEWVGEAMEAIGSVNQLDHKVEIIEIHDYQAKLPCDLFRLNSVAYSGCTHGMWLPAKKTTGTFSVYLDKHDHGHCCKMIVQDSELISVAKSLYGLDDDKAALDLINSNLNVKQTLSCLLNDYTYCSKNGHTHCHNHSGTNFSPTVQYDVKPGYLMFNVRHGFAKISYHAIYTDEDSMPMIPDMHSYKEAIFWYVSSKILYRRLFKGQIKADLYALAKQSYNFYRKQAYAESLLPNQDEMTDLKYTWQTLVPEIDEEDTFFSTTGDKQDIYNQSGLWK